MRVSQLAVMIASLVLINGWAGEAQAVKTRGLKVVRVTQRDGKKVELYMGSHALLIGVSDYTAGWPDLEAVPAELDKLQSALEQQGFNVTRVRNPDNRQIKRAFEDFIDKYGYEADNRLLIFYSGHGYTRKPGGRQKGYLVPANSPNPLKNEKGFLRKSLDMGQIQTWARTIEAKHALFLFDSCFSGTIFKTRALPAPRHITDKTSKPVRQFITAGSAGEEVPARSVFLPSFIRAIKGEGDINKDGYVTGTELGQFLHERVLSYNSGQTPQFGKIRDPALDEGDFVFALPAGAGVASGIEKPGSRLNAEDEFWAAIKDSNNPAHYQSYLQKYPVGRFADIAKIKLELVRPRTKPAEPPPPEIAAVRPKRVMPRVLTPPTRVKTWRDPVTGMEFVKVPGGSFEMGCHANAGNCDSDERPTRTIKLDGFWLGKHEVTQGQWKKIMGRNPSEFKKGDTFPVDSVSWTDAQRFVSALNSKGKSGTFRLPTEAEWEFACRANGRLVNYGTAKREASHANARYESPEGTFQIAAYSPNQSGIFDMSGNVAEWVLDPYDPAAYRSGTATNPIAKAPPIDRGSNLQKETTRVIRGGSWASRASQVRCTARADAAKTARNPRHGIRLAKNL